MSEEPIIWLAGKRWDDVPGTDHRLVGALARSRPVLWVDPPRSPLRRPAARVGWSSTEVGPGVHRLQVVAVPGKTRPVLRQLARAMTGAAVRSMTATTGAPSAVVVAHPLACFPRGVPGVRLLYGTDDWLSGAALMGLSSRAVRGALRRSVASADAVLGVSDAVLTSFSPLHGSRESREATAHVVLPNGAPVVPTTDVRREPVAGLVGQLNERLDLDVLEAVVRAGVRLRVIGPRADADPAFGARLDRLLASPSVEWLGGLDQGRLHRELGRIGVGLTPYADTSFNRASSPLKTLEYLAAGVPVVSTDLPAARWLDTPLVTVRDGATAFATAVAATVRTPPNAELERRCRSFAAGHDWSARADQLLRVVDECAAGRPVAVSG